MKFPRFKRPAIGRLIKMTLKYNVAGAFVISAFTESGVKLGALVD
jgi:hypothetical protein